MKHLLLGDEAIAQGAIDAGLSGVYAYPGTPSTEITEYIQLSEARKQKAGQPIAANWQRIWWWRPVSRLISSRVYRSPCAMVL